MATNKEQHDARDGGRYARGAEQQADGQPENAREMEESGMGGTSDAGSAADEAAESANLGRGANDDRTRRPGA